MNFLKKNLIIISFLFAFFGFSIQANAQINNIINTPFGGIITATLPCTCSGNFLITVFDYRTFNFLPLVVSPPFSKLYQYWTFVPGAFTLGTYSPGPKCLVTVTGADCEEVPSRGAVNRTPGAGTSLPSF